MESPRQALTAVKRRLLFVARYRVGRRGAFMAFLAILDCAYGWALHLQTVIAVKALTPDLLLPLTLWSWLWVGMGVVCLSGVFTRRDRVPYALSSAFQATWAAVYANAWLAHGLTSGWISAVVWLSFAVTILLIGSWPDDRSVYRTGGR